MDELQRGWELLTHDDFDSSERCFRRVLAAPDATELQRSEARFGLGYCLAFTARYDQARAEYVQLRHAAQVDGDHHAEHRALHQIGMVERMAGDWSAAARCFQEERGMIEALGSDFLAVAINSYELGFVALHLGQMDESKAHFERARLAAEQTTDLIAVGCARRGLGDWHDQNGNRDDAVQQWEAAQRSFTEAGDEKAVLDVRQRIVISRE